MINKNNRNIEAVVAGHICLDLYPQLNSAQIIEPGKLIQAGPMHFAAGGAVANTGLALGKLGIKTRLIGCTGEDYFAPTIKKLIHQPRIEPVILNNPNITTSYSVVISPKGKDRSFIHHPGANDFFDPKWVTDKMLNGAKLLHFGYPPIMKKTFEDGGQNLANMFSRAKKLGLITSLDMCDFSLSSPAGEVDWQKWLQIVLPHVDYFTPSYGELALMLNENVKENPSKTTLENVADKCLKMGCLFALVKLADKGVFAKASDNKLALGKIANQWEESAGKSFKEPCYKVKANGTTAAGDSTIAGFLAGILKYKSIENALHLATGVGAMCVESKEGINAIKTIQEVEQRIERGWKKRD